LSAYYLVDTFTSPVANSRIIDVEEPSDLQVTLNGAFVVRVPDGVQVVNPTDVTDLLTQKYQGLLADNAGFLYCTYDDLLDSTHVDPTAGPGMFGQRSLIALAPGGTFVSVINAGAGTPLTGSAPGTALVTWEVFSVTDADPSSGILVRTYTELPSVPSNLTCEVSFNGGSTYNPTTDSSVLNVVGGDQGTAFIIQLTNVTQGRLYLGSWAVVY
jgi:hypothetical protein